MPPPSRVCAHGPPRVPSPAPRCQFPGASIQASGDLTAPVAVVLVRFPLAYKMICAMHNSYDDALHCTHTHTHRVWPAGTVQTRIHSSSMKFVRNIVFSPRGRRATRRRLRADSDWRPARFSHRMGPPRRAGRMWRDAARRTASRARLARAHTYADRNTSQIHVVYASEVELGETLDFEVEHHSTAARTPGRRSAVVLPTRTHAPPPIGHMV